ncbi:MAG: hypothetical protein GEV11_01750 [Streptosporangiales bacterium]|nr:hypothetical protein [Streptosporangiales bacterium]
MMDLRTKPYAAGLLAALGAALGLILLRSPVGSGGQDALLAADGGFAATTAPYGVAVWLLAAAAAAWFGTPPVGRPGWETETGLWTRGTLDEARPACLTAGVTLGLLTPIVLMAPLMEGEGSLARWLAGIGVLEVAVVLGVLTGRATARFPLLAVPLLAGATGLIALLAVRLTLIEMLVPADLAGPVGGITDDVLARLNAVTTWSPLAAGVGAAIGGLLGVVALPRSRSPWWALTGALTLPVVLGAGTLLALPVSGLAALRTVGALEWAALVAGGLLGGLVAAGLRALTGGRRRASGVRGDLVFSGDSGQGMIEYVGLTLVAVAVITGIFVTSGAYHLLPPRLEYAICRVVSGDCPVSAAEIPGTPDVNSCTVRADLEEHVERTKVLIWSDEDKDSVNVAEGPDGNISVTEGDSDASGFDVRLGVGVKVNGIGIGASIGGGYLWTGQDQTQVQFESDEQQAEFQEAVDNAYQDFLEDAGGDIFDMSDEEWEEFQDVPRQVAADMGLPYSRMHADGDTVGIDAEASVGFDEGSTGVKGLEAELGVGAGYSESHLIGTGEHYDAEGNRTTSEYRVISDEFALSLGVSVDLQGLGPEASVAPKWQSENVMEVKYDADGNPTELVVTRTTQYHIEGGIGVGYTIEPGGRQSPGSSGRTESDNEQGAGGFAGKELSDGDVVVTTTTIPLEPGDADVMDDYIHGDFEERLNAAVDIAPMYDRPDTVVTEQHYDSARETDGTDLSGSFIIELGAYQNTTSTQTMDLEDATYRDPQTGEMVPWVECEAGD